MKVKRRKAQSGKQMHKDLGHPIADVARHVYTILGWNGERVQCSGYVLVWGIKKQAGDEAVTWSP
jgi:hypothetical protein